MGRQRKECPLCSVKGLVRLSNHLVTVHGIKDVCQRMHWLDVAKKTGSQDLQVVISQQQEILVQQRLIRSQLSILIAR